MTVLHSLDTCRYSMYHVIIQVLHQPHAKRIWKPQAQYVIVSTFSPTCNIIIRISHRQQNEQENMLREMGSQSEFINTIIIVICNLGFSWSVYKISGWNSQLLFITITQEKSHIKHDNTECLVMIEWPQDFNNSEAQNTVSNYTTCTTAS